MDTKIRPQKVDYGEENSLTILAFSDKSGALTTELSTLKNTGMIKYQVSKCYFLFKPYSKWRSYINNIVKKASKTMIFCIQNQYTIISIKLK